MSKRSVTHASFSIERVYPATPARVFAAFADPRVKARWFTSPKEWGESEYKHDFRIGGTELNRSGPPGGPVYTYRARFQDIVPDERIITTYEMLMDDARISVSVATIELKAVAEGTRLTLTEQGAFLDGFDKPEIREEGTRGLLQMLAADIAQHP
jgi:uncharacterized protein YndB with AHSA1/START domain